MIDEIRDTDIVERKVTAALITAGKEDRWLNNYQLQRMCNSSSADRRLRKMRQFGTPMWKGYDLETRWATYLVETERSVRCKEYRLVKK